MLELPFAAQEGDSGVTQNSRETLINMYAESEGSGRSKLVRRQRPGTSLVVQAYGTKRGIAEFTHGTYCLIRNTFYRLDGSGLTELGTINTNVGPVTIITDDNGDMFIADGETGYHYDAGTETLAPVVTPTDVGTCDVQGGRGIYNVPGGNQWYISGLNDFSSWDALDFASAESNPDFINRVFVDHGEVWLFGDKTVEIFRATSDVDFPYSYNTTLQRGCLAKFSVAADDNSIFWLGNDQIVYRADGYRPARVSTHAVEEWIEGAPDKTNAESFIYTVRGHKFYVLSFPGYGTRQLNLATGLWNLCRSWGRADWEITGGAGKQTGNYLTPRGVVTLDSAKNTDSGTIMERGGISAPVASNGDLLTLSAFWLDAEVGRVDGETDPQVMLQVSRDGEEFGNVLTRGLGETGKYLRRAVWRGLGQAREFTLKITCTDDVSLKIMSTNGDIA